MSPATICQTYVNEMFPLYMNFYRLNFPSLSGGFAAAPKSEKLAAKRAIESYVELNDVERIDCEAAARAAMTALDIKGAVIPGLNRIGKKPGSTYLGKNAHLRARAKEQGAPYRPARKR